MGKAAALPYRSRCHMADGVAPIAAAGAAAQGAEHERIRRARRQIRNDHPARLWKRADGLPGLPAIRAHLALVTIRVGLRVQTHQQLPAHFIDDCRDGRLVERLLRAGSALHHLEPRLGNDASIPFGSSLHVSRQLAQHQNDGIKGIIACIGVIRAAAVGVGVGREQGLVGGVQIRGLDRRLVKDDGVFGETVDDTRGEIRQLMRRQLGEGQRNVCLHNFLMVDFPVVESAPTLDAFKKFDSSYFVFSKSSFDLAKVDWNRAFLPLSVTDKLWSVTNQLKTVTGQLTFATEKLNSMTNQPTFATDQLTSVTEKLKSVAEKLKSVGNQLKTMADKPTSVTDKLKLLSKKLQFYGKP